MTNDRTSALIKASALAARPEFSQLLREHLHEVKQSSVAKPNELYEAFLQLYLFAGFPAALEAVRALRNVCGDERYSLHEEMNYDHFKERGTSLYKRVYAKNAQHVRDEMLALSPELAEWALIEGYGKTLSRPGLDEKTRELCIVAILTQLSWKRQLFSHILGAHNVGGDREEITDAIAIGAMGDDEKRIVAEQLLQKITYSA